MGLSGFAVSPHTGARLETRMPRSQVRGMHVMPPTRGHDLKLEHADCRRHAACGCPPHGGTT